MCHLLTLCKAAVKHLVLGDSLVKKWSMAQTLGDLKQTKN